jgi:hypothetical protein
VVTAATQPARKKGGKEVRNDPTQVAAESGVRGLALQVCRQVLMLVSDLGAVERLDAGSFDAALSLAVRAVGESVHLPEDEAVAGFAALQHPAGKLVGQRLRAAPSNSAVCEALGLLIDASPPPCFRGLKPLLRDVFLASAAAHVPSTAAERLDEPLPAAKAVIDALLRRSQPGRSGELTPRQLSSLLR